jgi:hypothetical protein
MAILDVVEVTIEVFNLEPLFDLKLQCFQKRLSANSPCQISQHQVGREVTK